MLDTSVSKSLTPAKWWKILGKKQSKSKEMATPEYCNFMTKISSLPASSASVECLFSTFGLVHTQLRNRSGNEKTEKPVMCHHTLRDANCDYL